MRDPGKENETRSSAWLRRLGVAIGLTTLVWIPLEAQTSPKGDRELARAMFEELIEIDTTHSSGDTVEAARAMATHLLAVGFPEEDVRVLVEAPRKGNLVARLRGRDTGRKPLLLLAHLDVVEADPADWSVDPFTFLERDGYYYGRGTTDDKGQAVIHVANLIRLRQEGFVPERDIIVALTSDEEGGAHNGVIWLLANHRELIEAELALNEGGGGALQDGKRLSNSVQLSEKVYQSFTLEVTNPGGHSSLPRTDNAIYRLAAGLVRISNHVFPVELNDVTRAYFSGTTAMVPPEIASAMSALVGDPSDPHAAATLAAVPAYNARMRTTCVATQLNAGHAENALPQRAQAVVNCRLLPGVDPREVLATLEQVMDDAEISVTPIQTATPSSPSPLTPEVLDAIERTTEEMWPGVPVIPTMSTGATDGLYLRNAGIPVYGVSGIFGEIDDVRAHGRDERISIQSFYEGQEFLYRLTKRLAGSW